MQSVAYSLGASILISSFSLAGLLFLAIKAETLQKYLLGLVALSTGTLLGGAFLHLIPEGLEYLDPETFFGIVLVSFIAFFLLEKVIHWRHCHNGECEVHTFGYINLVGDALHNFIDGAIIALAFMADFYLGVTTALALAFHEIPQEIGDFGVLLYAGFEKKKALALNVLVALTSVLGTFAGLYYLNTNQNALGYLLPVAAGSFLYISTSDLLPEIRDQTNQAASVRAVLLFLVGVVLMQALKLFG